MATCLADECKRQSKSRGYCQMHYTKLRRAGVFPKQCKVDSDVAAAVRMPTEAQCVDALLAVRAVGKFPAQYGAATLGIMGS